MDNKIKKITYRVLITFIFIAHTYLFLYYINCHRIFFYILAEERPGDLERFYESTKGSFFLILFFIKYCYLQIHDKKHEKNFKK